MDLFEDCDVVEVDWKDSVAFESACDCFKVDFRSPLFLDRFEFIQV